MRNRLAGEALVFKRLMDRGRLKYPDNGVQYFKDIFKTQLCQGSTTCVSLENDPVYYDAKRKHGASEVDSEIPISVEAPDRFMDGSLGRTTYGCHYPASSKSSCSCESE